MKRKFGYNCYADFCKNAVIAILLVILIVLLERGLLSITDVTESDLEYLKKFNIFSGFLIVVSFVSEEISCIIKTRCNYLLIDNYQLVYFTGWIQRRTTTISANKIRSCSKSSGILQRVFGVGNIEVTTAGDSAEIVFCSLREYNEAYDLIVKMTQR